MRIVVASRMRSTHQHRKHIIAMSVKTNRAALQRLKHQRSEAEQRQQWAWDNAAEVYRERDLLVAALARCYPSHVMEAGKGRAAICIHTPAGQLAWMLPTRSQGRLQAHGGTLHDCLKDLPTTANDWDKAKTADRFERLERLAKHTA